MNLNEVQIKFLVLGIPDHSMCVPIPPERIGSCGVPGQVLSCVLLTVQCCDYHPGHAQYCAVIRLCAIIRLCGYVTSLPGHVGRYECTWPVAECIVIGYAPENRFWNSK